MVEAMAPGRCCWAVLLTHAQYLPGIAVLRHSLARHRTRFPFVIMVTPDVDAPTRSVLQAMRCVVRDVPPWTVDVPDTGMANARFAHVWTKLRAFALVEYERVVLLDSDMLVCQGIDELMDVALPHGCIAACSACTCNPNAVASYPRSWVPANCAYTARENGVTASFPMPTPPDTHALLNSGVVVLTPSLEDERQLAAFIDEHPARIAAYKFPDQDLLADVYAARWVPLAWHYNALKTLRRCHARLWTDGDVRIIHYILDKPWNTDPHAVHLDMDVHAWWWAAYYELAAAPGLLGLTPAQFCTQIAPHVSLSLGKIGNIAN